MQQVALFHNPTAGDQDLSQRELVSALRRHGYEPKCFDSQRDFRRSRAVHYGEFVIVAGGDGSVKRAAQTLAHTGRVLAILPMGTANNIARSLGLEGTPEELIRAWKHSAPTGVDLGRARGPWGERHFIESLGVGLIGRGMAIIRRMGQVTDHRLSLREDRLYRAVSILYALAHDVPPVRLRVGLDGARKGSGKFLLWEVLNIRRSGPGIELSARADPTDGFLDMLTVTAGERAELKTQLERTLAGKAGLSRLRSQRVREIALTLGRTELRLDDEVVWPPPRARRVRNIAVRVSVEPGALLCLLPAKDRRGRRRPSR